MTNFDLKTLNLANGTHSITVVAKASRYKDSEPSNTVNYVVGSGETTITFTIDGTSYQAENGMTWSEWCSSTYNTGREDGGETLKYYVDTVGNISVGSHAWGYWYMVALNDEWVLDSDIITSGNAYDLITRGAD